MATTTAAQQILNGPGVTPGEDLPERYWELISRYRGELLNQAFAILASQEDAEDVVQETFCEAVRHAARLAEARSLGAWLRQINRANALNRLRERRSRTKRSDRLQSMGSNRTMTTGGFNLIELRETVAKAIEELPDELRETVVLRYWENLPHEEIAQKLGVAEITVRRRLYEAGLTLHKSLRVVLKGPLPPGGLPETGV